MDAAAVSPAERKLTADERLLAHVVEVEDPERACRPSVDERLDALLGHELARKLVQALTAR